MIDRQPFGATGHLSSRIVFGAAALGAASDRLADDVLATLLEFGINHIDTAASYGESETVLARWMPAHRQDFFLATKTGDRTGTDARASLERSLDRMGVDRVDLIQLHNLVEEDEWQTAFASGGAVDALFAARDEGLVDHVGVTGHGLRIANMHRRSIAEAPFASVLLPYSYLLLQHDEYRADVTALLAECAERDIAVQTIKSIARRRWTAEETPRFSWYEPLADDDAIARAVHYVMDNPQVFLNTSSDARLLRLILEAAHAFGGAPDANALEADRLVHGMTPLFDGDALEVI